MEVKSIFNNVLEITVGYSIFNYPDSIAIIVFQEISQKWFGEDVATKEVKEGQ
ncbi:hypothetical protein [Streptococcus pneumoniae]|uniref:hypothetical protein n=1 Tax=Streptococcus pneumoniae TaxID=1313 RepID=UPI000ABC7044|nr:hypothetical protein [Streptococcus pneumoniae]